MRTFHSQLPYNVEPDLVVEIVGKKFTIFANKDGSFDVYDFENKLTQPGHDAAGVVRYLTHVFHGLSYVAKKNPKN